MVKLTDNIVYGRTKSATESVRRLNLWGCEIDDISLCAKMTNLEILSISVNRVQDVEPLKNCKQLQELYLRKNELADLGQLEHLRNLEQLRVLWLEENPCCPENDHSYRRKVLKILPHLTMLDNKAVSKEEVASAQLPSPPPSVIYHDRRGSLSQHSSVDRSPSHTLMSTSNTSDPDNPRFDHLANDSDYAYVSPRENPMISSNHGSYYMQNNPQHHDFQGDSTPVNEVAFYDPTAPVTSIMSTSLYGTSIPELPGNDVDGAQYSQPDWNDFAIEDVDQSIPMSQSVGGSLSARVGPETFVRHPTWYTRSLNIPKRRNLSGRSRSASPSAQRHETILSAIAVLMDELDQRGLRAVIEEAQRRMKKRR